MRNYIFTLLLLFSSILTFAQPAPDFTIVGTDNQTHHLYADYLNEGKTVVLKLMFVACPPCNQIAPATQTLYEDWGEGTGDVEFFSLSTITSDDNSEMLGYEQMHNLTYPGAGADGGGFTATIPYQNGTYGPFFGTPTFVVIAPNGSVNFDVAGAGQAGTIAALDAAIEATGASRPGMEVFYNLNGSVNTEVSQGIGQVQLAVNDQSSPITTGASGQFSFQNIASSTMVDIAPSKNINHRNGVSTFDIVNVQKHILQIQLLDSPYKMIAADINRSKTITTFDLIQIRKLILFIDTVFTQNTSWRFVPASYVFPNPQNPLNDNFPESIQIDPLNQDFNMLDFIGIKIGDLNGSASPAALMDADSRNLNAVTFEIENQDFEAGDIISIPFYAADFQDIIAFQFTLNFDQELMEFVKLDGSNVNQKLTFSEEHLGLVNLNKGKITVSWNDIEGINLQGNDVVFQLNFRAKNSGNLSKALQINSTLTSAEAYTSTGNAKAVLLQTNPQQHSFTKLPYLQPNSIQDESVLSFSIAQPTEVQLEIFSSVGQLVQQHSLGIFSAGDYKQQLDFKSLSNGLYYLTLNFDGKQMHSLPFVITR